MASTNQDKKLIWDSDKFATMYATAEKLTGVYARVLLERAGLDKVTNDEELVILDHACGTGIVSAHLMDMLSEKSKDKLKLTCADFADAMVSFVGNRIASSGWKNTDAVKADAMDTKLPTCEYTHIILNFGPMVFPNWQAAMREQYRMLRPGGTLAMSSWQVIGWVPDVRAAFETELELSTLFPSDDEFRHIFSSGRWDNEAWIQETIPHFGFGDVNTLSVPNTSILDGLEEFKGIIEGTVGIVLARCWSQEQREKYGNRAKDVVIKYMAGKYGHGEIKWQWNAILTTAKKPEES